MRLNAQLNQRRGPHRVDAHVAPMLPLAAKIHEHNTAGVYLTHDSQVIQSLVRHAPGTYWIDGYQMVISNQTQVCLLA